METTLHRELKHHYAANSDSIEVSVEGFRIDAIDSDGQLIEIQHSGMGAIRSKVRKLLDSGHWVRVVKPLIERKWIESPSAKNTVGKNPDREPRDMDPKKNHGPAKARNRISHPVTECPLKVRGIFQFSDQSDVLRCMAINGILLGTRFRLVRHGVV